MKNELKVTKERVLKAANSCPTAKGVLEKLFPEAFVPNGSKWDIIIDGFRYCIYGSGNKSPQDVAEVVAAFLGGTLEMQGTINLDENAGTQCNSM
jgi:hypothetical protein